MATLGIRALAQALSLCYGQVSTNPDEAYVLLARTEYDNLAIYDVGIGDLRVYGLDAPVVDVEAAALNQTPGFALTLAKPRNRSNCGPISAPDLPCGQFS